MTLTIEQNKYYNILEKECPELINCGNCFWYDHPYCIHPETNYDDSKVDDDSYFCYNIKLNFWKG